MEVFIIIKTNFFLFYSRVISGRQSTNFNHDAFDIESIKFDNKILFWKT